MTDPTSRVFGTALPIQFTDEATHVRLTVASLDDDGSIRVALSLDNDPTHILLCADIDGDDTARLRDYIDGRAAEYEQVEQLAAEQARVYRAAEEAERGRRAFRVRSGALMLRGRYIGQEYTVHRRNCPVIANATPSKLSDFTLSNLADVLGLVNSLERNTTYTMRFCKRCKPLGELTAQVNQIYDGRPPMNAVEDALIATDHYYRNGIEHD